MSKMMRKRKVLRSMTLQSISNTRSERRLLSARKAGRGHSQDDEWTAITGITARLGLSRQDQIVAAERVSFVRRIGMPHKRGGRGSHLIGQRLIFRFVRKV